MESKTSSSQLGPLNRIKQIKLMSVLMQSKITETQEFRKTILSRAKVDEKAMIRKRYNRIPHHVPDTKPDSYILSKKRNTAR